MLQWPDQRQEEKESQYKRTRRERSDGGRAPKLACGFGSLQCAPALRRVTRREGGREKRTRNKKRRRDREGRNGRATERRNEETASVSGQLKQRYCLLLSGTRKQLLPGTGARASVSVWPSMEQGPESAAVSSNVNTIKRGRWTRSRPPNAAMAYGCHSVPRHLMSSWRSAEAQKREACSQRPRAPSWNAVPRTCRTKSCDANRHVVRNIKHLGA